MWANNETGVVFPVKELALLCREVGAPLFCDAAQAAGKVPLHLDDLAADLVAITGEKLGGPRGTGALFVTPGLRLSPLLGGEQERGRRGGTENPPGAAGLAAALKVAAREQPLEAERLGRLRDLFEQGLQSALPFARVNAKGAPRLSSTSSITFPGTDGEALLMALDLSGLCASAGSACHSGSTSPSPVLLAMGMPEEEARATLRFSFGWTTTQAEVDLALELIPPIVRRVKDAIPAAS
jgi:cysteine desulfurase